MLGNYIFHNMWQNYSTNCRKAYPYYMENLPHDCGEDKISAPFC